MRKIFALALAVSIYAVSAVVSVWADDISPGQQQELASIMVMPVEQTPVYIPVDPGQGTHIPGAPPAVQAGSEPETEARCNSPGKV